MKKEIKINEVGQVMLTTDNGMLDYDGKNKLISENEELKSIKYEWEHVPKWIIKLFI